MPALKSASVGTGDYEERKSAFFTALGRAALRTVTVIDEAGRGREDSEVRALWQDEPEGVVTLRNVLPTWSVRLLVLCLLAPALLAALDAFFRVRRRRAGLPLTTRCRLPLHIPVRVACRQ